MPYKNVHDIPTYIHDMFAFERNEAFTKAAIIVLAAVATYIFPNAKLQETAIATGALVFLDTTTGIAVAVKKGIQRSSTAFSRVLAKTFCYLAVCAVAAIVEKTILNDSGISITMSVLWLIIATEGISILENVEAISGGKFRLLKAILGKVITDDDKAAKAKEEETKP
jgi:phage-related holin